jgi:hypothetical protein
MHVEFLLRATPELRRPEASQSRPLRGATDLYPNTVTTAPPNGDMPWFSSPETASPLPVVYFFDCVTTLLFPYINTFIGGGSYAFSNFGTGIALANTTLDPLALPGPYAGPCPGGSCLYSGEAPGTAIPQSGSCTVYFYPGDGSATQVYTTPGISAGGSFAFDVASGVPSFAGKTGYAMAICNFQNAYGFAEIYDNYLNLAGAGPNATVGYLAEVLPDPALYHRSPAGDGLGEGAIAPIDVEQDQVDALLAIIRRRRLLH